MVRFILLAIACAFCVLALLTVFKTPECAPWQLGVLVGEYGHWLALGALAVALAGAAGHPHWLSVAAAAGGLFAAALLLKPCLQAWQIARVLPAEFDQVLGARGQYSNAFAASRGSAVPGRDSGGAPRRERPFRWRALVASNPVTVAPRALRYGPTLALDFYPAFAASPAPCVIVVHGGGWDNGDQHEFVACNEALARAGYAVAAITYRLAPRERWPAQRHDLLAAIAYMKAHADELGVDPRRLVLLGRSAGGQIVEAVAYGAPDPSVRGVIALYAPADLEFAYRFGHEDDVIRSPLLLRQLLGGTPATAPEMFREASGYFHVTHDSPPTLLLHGASDPLVWHRQSERLAQQLAEHGVPHVFVSLPWATHAFDYNPHGPGGQLSLWAIERFLASVTAPRPPK